MQEQSLTMISHYPHPLSRLQASPFPKFLLHSYFMGTNLVSEAVPSINPSRSVQSFFVSPTQLLDLIVPPVVVFFERSFLHWFGAGGSPSDFIFLM